MIWKHMVRNIGFCYLIFPEIHVLPIMIPSDSNPDSKVYGANMGPTSILSAPDGPHVGPINLAIREDMWCILGLLCVIYEVNENHRVTTTPCVLHVPLCGTANRQPWYQGSLGQHGAHLGPVGPRWAPCWPNEPCYLGDYKDLLIRATLKWILKCSFACSMCNIIVINFMFLLQSSWFGQILSLNCWMVSAKSGGLSLHTNYTWSSQIVHGLSDSINSLSIVAPKKFEIGSSIMGYVIHRFHTWPHNKVQWQW